MAAGGLEVGGDPREQLLHNHQSPLEKEMKMTGVRHARPVLTAVRQLVPLDDGDAVEVVGQHASREHAADASAHHDGVAVGDCTFVPMLRRASVLHGSPPFGCTAASTSTTCPKPCAQKMPVNWSPSTFAQLWGGGGKNFISPSLQR